MSKKITAAITAIGGYVPEDRLTNADLEKIVEKNGLQKFRFEEIAALGLPERRVRFRLRYRLRYQQGSPFRIP